MSEWSNNLVEFMERQSEEREEGGGDIENAINTGTNLLFPRFRCCFVSIRSIMSIYEGSWLQLDFWYRTSL